MTEKLLEAIKKKLTQLELQLDEETGRGISSIEKVTSSVTIILQLYNYIIMYKIKSVTDINAVK